MSSRTLRTSLVSVLVVVAVAACSSGSGGGSGFSVTNLGLAIADMTGDGDLWLLAVSESDQDGTDLNGDGDANDRVLHVLDLAAGTAVNLGLDVTPLFPVPAWRVRGDVAAFAVNEAHEGADLNGDGDAVDLVLHVYDHGTGTVRNVGLAMLESPPDLGSGVVAFFVSEEEQDQTDLDGDGDAFDFVLHVHDVQAGTTDDTELEPNGKIAIGGGFLAFTLPERSLADLNADGDMTDVAVAHLYELATGNLIDIGVASGFEFAFLDGRWILDVLEHLDGDADRNGDGDSEDRVLYAYDPGTGLLVPLGYDGTTTQSAAGGRILVLGVETGGFDRNGDGDTGDFVPALFEPSTGASWDTNLAFDEHSACTAFLGESLALGVNESDQGLDLNGDGDTLDNVAHVVDPVLGTTTNLELDTFCLASSEHVLVLARFELTAGEDLNADGDEQDAVLFLWDARTGLVTNTKIASTGGAEGVTDARMLMVSPQGTGPGTKLEYVVYDVAGKTAYPLGLRSGFRNLAQLSPSGRAVLAVNEAAQGADLNGDGDMTDEVVHVLL